MDHYKQNQALMPIAALFSDAASLMEKISITPATWVA